MNLIHVNLKTRLTMYASTHYEGDQPLSISETDHSEDVRIYICN